MPTNISVSTPVQSVAITENSYDVSVVGDTATVSVSTNTPAVNVETSTSTFTINTIANKADIGLGNVDNTSDINKPISTATQTALNAKLNKSGGTMAGSLVLAADPTENLQAATKSYVDGQVNSVPVILSSDDVAEGSINLYYTTERFDDDFATKTTTNVVEGTNLYFTTARARQSISGTGGISYNSTTGQISYSGGENPTTTDELPEGSTNLYYTSARANSDFDTRLGTKTTTNVVEGTNLYYTSARANSDFDTRLGTKTTTNLAEGTNLYYTTARANSDFDTRLGTKTTDNLSEGSTNKYYSNILARGAISAGSGISYNSSTGSVAVDTSTIATRSYADSAAASAAAAVVDAAPATLDTLNELAAALGDDPNFATTITTSIGNKLNTGDFNTTADDWLASKTTTNLAEGTNLYYTNDRFNTQLATKSTSDLAEGTQLYYTDGRFDTRFATKTTTNLAEGTNLYYTDARARGAFSAGSNITITDGVIASTGGSYTDANARSAVANGVDLAVDGSSNVYVKSMRDYTRIKGALEATRNDSYVFPESSSSLLSGSNGFDAASSGPDADGPLGYSVGFALSHYYGDTAAGNSVSPAFTTRTAAGTNSSPTAITNASVMGSYNWGGYSGTDFASVVGTTNGGGGRNVTHPLQFQGYANQNFTEGTISVATTATTQLNLTIGSVASSGSGVFTNTSGDIRQYDVVRITGTLSGTMTFPGYASGNLYYVIAGANPTTTFTLSATQDGTAISTGAGTTTGLTFTRHRSLITFATQTNTPFGPGGLLTVAGITPAGYNGNHRAVYGTTTQVAYGNYQTGTTQTVAGTVSQYNVTAGGAGFRVRGFPSSVPYNTANRINFIDANATAATYRSDLFTWQGATNTFNYMQLSAGGATFNTGGITIKDLAGTNTYYSLSILKALSSVPVRSSVTTATITEGSTYTPAATANNNISLTINTGSGTSIIDLINLTGQGDGGMYSILIFNNAATGTPIQVKNTRINTNNLTTHTIPAGSRIIVTVYVVGDYATSEHLVVP